MKNQFEVLYTRQKTQKTKTWHDGVVVIDNLNGVRRISLYKIDENGCRGELVDAFSSYSREINISKINFPGHLIEFVAEIQEESGSKETVSVLKSSGDSYSGIVNVQPENYCQNENTQKCIARPFKTPLVKLNQECPKPKQIKTPKKVSNIVPINKISSKRGIIKTLEKISWLV